MSIILHASAVLCVSYTSAAEASRGVMTDRVPVGGELSEQRWITLTDSDCALSCDASPPEALPFVFFKLFSVGNQMRNLVFTLRPGRRHLAVPEASASWEHIIAFIIWRAIMSVSLSALFSDRSGAVKVSLRGLNRTKKSLLSRRCFFMCSFFIISGV